MIKVNVNEVFPISAALVNEETGQMVSGEAVNYDIRKQPGDVTLSPPKNGNMTESNVEAGIYTYITSIAESGSFTAYVTCSGFISNTEDIIVNEENIYDLVKQNRHYNISVEDVIRTNAVPTASQTARNVPMNRTDYIITLIKGDDDSDWYGTTTSGIVYAWYNNITDELPYLMGGPL